MNRSAQIIVGIFLGICLILWSAVWWVTRGPPVNAVTGISAARQSATPVSNSATPRFDVDPAAGRDAAKPRTEPAPPPLPPPLKPDAQGAIDLSSDPSTKAFTEALQQGYARRLAEPAKRQPEDAPSNR